MSRVTSTDVLTKARALIARPRGWVKHDFQQERKDGLIAYCAMGANTQARIELAAPFGSEKRANDRLRKAIRDYTGDPTFLSVAEFNDLPKTSRRDVLAIFDRAIKMGAR